ncbi:MAG TPA: TetR/AcrR family transcriptional regulator [Anaerolineales bacterium]|jgi:AcrR family transcriptional regulator|nr:TetR/AcrR family transcriptional regulator [Anaerolineales bacterium]
MVRPIKKKQIPNLQDAIKETAWKQIAEFGAPALSLRAIARELKITAPAIYNYFPDRDALVTALIIDAYTSFGDWQIEARDSASNNNLHKKLEAIGLAYRNWAHTYPQRYQLIFGTPIPGYITPREEVFPSSARSISALFSVVEEFHAAGKLSIDAVPAVSEKYKTHYEQWRTYLGEINPLSVFVAMIIWARVHGIVSLEIQGNLPSFGKKGDALYLFELHSISHQFIKE